MSEEPGLSDQYRMASPWPVFVALGLALSEVGVILGVLPVAVGGLLLFGGSVVGILRESEYVAEPWTPLLAFGGVLALLGGVLIATQAGEVDGVVALFTSGNGYVSRGIAVVVAGAFLAAAGGAGRVLERSAV